MGLNGFIFKKNIYIIEKLKSCELFRSCLLNSTANPAQFWWKWAGLAVLFSRQLLNGSKDFNFSNILIYYFKYEIIETHARAFLTLIILGIATVHGEFFQTTIK